MTASRLSPFLLLAVMTLAVPRAGSAQLGGLIKKKAGEVIQPKAPEATQPSQPSGGAQPAGTPRFGGDVVEVTAPVFEATLSRMDAEAAMQNEFRRELARYPTQEQYNECNMRTAASPEAQKISAKMAEIPEGTTAEEFQRIMVRIGAEMEALVKRNCPLDPNDWNDAKRRTRLQEIHATATASGPTRAHDILIERTVRYCQAKAEGIDVTGGPDGLKIPGEGRNVFWVWTASEVEVLSRINCERFLQKHENLTAV